MGSPELDQIRERGWAETLFMVSEEGRAEYARLANVVIGIALENETVREALTFVLNPGQPESERAGTFGLGTARNSSDAKITLHTGFQSREAANAVLPERLQPTDMMAFWKEHAAMLAEVEVSFRSTLAELGAVSLLPHIFPNNVLRRNVHMRTVRYADALLQPVGKEVVGGHADLGIATMHLYETHGGWFLAAPYPAEFITAEDSTERREAVRGLRDGLRRLPQIPDFAPLFLGANWQTYPGVPKSLRDLPALYHAGFRPGPADETVSEFAAEVTGGNDDRVSVITFIHPNGDELLNGRYVPATVSNCRPEYSFQRV